MNKDTIKKLFHWHVLLTNEHSLAYQEPNYYGGFELTQELLFVPSKRWITPEIDQQLRKYALEEIQKYGIDWDKTETPELKKYYEFNGTGRRDAERSILEGVLFLNNGSQIEWIISERDYTLDPFDVVAFLHMKEDHAKFGMNLGT